MYSIRVRLEGILEVVAESEDHAVERVRSIPIEQIAEESDTEVEYSVLGHRDA